MDRRIMIIEDDPMIRTELQMLLKRAYPHRQEEILTCKEDEYECHSSKVRIGGHGGYQQPHTGGMVGFSEKRNWRQ